MCVLRWGVDGAVLHAGFLVSHVCIPDIPTVLHTYSIEGNLINNFFFFKTVESRMAPRTLFLSLAHVG
jgi:hypothetical protein